MTAIVVDASVLATALVDDGPDGDTARQRLSDQSLVAPSLIDLEVTSTVRGLVRGGRLDDRRARLALNDLLTLPLERTTHEGLVTRCWELRDNLTVYDAAYVALAELLDTVLVTGDARLARASGVRCTIELLTSPT
jgi:predicted nucleic acid-binding protein